MKIVSIVRVRIFLNDPMHKLDLLCGTSGAKWIGAKKNGRQKNVSFDLIESIKQCAFLKAFF